MAAIKKRSLVDQVYEMLRGDIITLRRPLGSKLNVNELQDELGVSCTPIREAVNRLQQGDWWSTRTTWAPTSWTWISMTSRRLNSWP